MLLIRKYRCDRKGKSGERMMMPSIIVQILYVLWMATIVPCETYTAECDHETLTVRAGFREHPTYCSKFIQCLLNKDGQLQHALSANMICVINSQTESEEKDMEIVEVSMSAREVRPYQGVVLWDSICIAVS
ncbi:hypothetical protein MAR_025771 [Mya arenaria]|uniref:Uncharacterized protein n=1 Tax=Mya arenaria TaxID=6604 RepID=A0ABY7EWN8_MYAAR|nr:hypothetical protein MAR_025771 [Mya arenaria]